MTGLIIAICIILVLILIAIITNIHVFFEYAHFSIVIFKRFGFLVVNLKS